MPTALGAEFHDTHLKLRPKLPWEDFEAECKTVGRMAKSNRWWAVDLILYGLNTYQDQAYQALDELSPDKRELMLLARMGDAFPPERRRSISFEHHRVALPLSPDQQDKWLLKAEQEKLSRAKLRKALQEAGLVTRRVRATPDEKDLWTRVRKALDLLKVAREQRNGSPWPDKDVARLIEALERVLGKEEAPT